MLYPWKKHHVQLHPSAWVAKSAEVIGNVSIEKDASVFFQAVIRGDKDAILIKEGSNIQDRCVLHTDPMHSLEIGKRVSVGHGCILHGCRIGDDCLIGMGAIILNGASIESHCIIGAGALVSEGMHIPKGSVVVGIPARIIKQCSDEQIRQIEENAKQYMKLSKEYRKEESAWNDYNKQR